MSFLHPALAWAGVASIALPIVIHFLFRRRRVSVEWAAIELLREAVRRTNRRMKFEQWIVLLLRSLLVLAAGLAIAVPVLDGQGFGGVSNRLVVVVIDNGPVGALREGQEPELARVVDEVRRLLSSSGTRDRVGVVVSAKPASLVLAPTGDAATVEQALSRIESMQVPCDLRGAIELARATIENERASGRASGERAVIVVASAFRQGSLPEGSTLVENRADPAPDAASRIEVLALVPARSAPSVDVRITRLDARPAPTGDAVLVRATVAREGSSLEEGRTTARIAATGMAASPPREIAWERGQAEASIDFQLVSNEVGGGARHVGIEMDIGADALVFGNTAFAAVEVRRDLEIGVVGRRTSLDATDIDRIPASLWVGRALSPSIGSGMRVREIDPSGCDERALLGLDAVVLARPDLVAPDACDALARFASSGGVVVVLPSGESLSQPWGQSVFTRLSVSMRTAAEAVEHSPPLRLADEQPGNPLLAAVEPEMAALVSPIEFTRTLACSGFTAGEVVLANADGSPFVIAQSLKGADGSEGRGLVVLFTAPPELPWTNLPVKPLMVPLFQEIARAGVQIAAGRSEVSVGDRVRGDASSALRLSDGASLSIAADGTSSEIVPRAGIWRADSGALVAANIRTPSIALAPNSVEAVRSALQPIGDVRFRADESQPEVGAEARAEWSFTLLVAALALLLTEGVLSRIFSHASIRRASQSESAVAIVGRVRKREPKSAAQTQPEAAGGRT